MPKSAKPAKPGKSSASQADPAALRARAIINGGKKWVNGTQLTYYWCAP